MTVEAEVLPTLPDFAIQRPSLGLPILFSATAFTGAALIFLVEPLVAKLLLPSYGGAATVWATSTLFFQVVLLGAYLLVHATSRLGRRRQPAAQLPLVLLALVVLPLALPADAAPDDGSPIVWLLRTLALMVALPFAVLATTGPLLQRWYAWTNGPRAEDPYFLYAASNVGSFVGLLAYPLIVEPRLTLVQQRTVWSWAFAAFILLVIAAAVAMHRSPAADPTSTSSEAPVAARVEAVTRNQRLRWMALAFLPSSLMLGVTTHISTDVAAIPLLWVIPLAIYLATMVAAFAGPRRAIPVRATHLAVLLGMVALTGSLLSPQMGVPVAIALDLTMLAVVSYAAHAQLAALRPDARDLTGFYVMVSLGGALGGLLNGVLAPMLLDRPIEYPLVLAVLPLLLLTLGGSRPIAAVLVLMLLAGTVIADMRAAGNALDRSRTFYGSYIVNQTSTERRLNHGTTLHGTQLLDPALAGEPTTYYSRSGPLGDVFALGDGRFDDVAAVGLGAGTVAAYGVPGQRMTFVEIDPEVIRIARDERFFTYLRDSRATIATVSGDGRIEVAKMPQHSLDLLVLDAFSSDAIPVHLLTREAMATYASRLRDDGVLAVHISNRVFDLGPVLADAAQAQGWRAAEGLGDGEGPGATPSRWVILTRDDQYVGALLAMSGWGVLSSTDPVGWTDDYSSVLSVLR